MTCVVGMIKKNGDIIVGADSCGSAGDSIISRKDPKVFIKDEMIFGFAGSFRMGNILHYKFQIPKRPRKMSANDYMNSVFIDEIRLCLTKHGLTKIENNVESIEGCFLVGYRGVIYCVESDLQVGIHEDDYIAIGSGADLASGALFATEKSEDCGGRVITALKAAAKFNSGVKPPFKILELQVKRRIKAGDNG